jgi:hypothetical protein
MWKFCCCDFFGEFFGHFINFQLSSAQKIMFRAISIAIFNLSSQAKICISKPYHHCHPQKRGGVAFLQQLNFRRFTACSFEIKFYEHWKMYAVENREDEGFCNLG